MVWVGQYNKDHKNQTFLVSYLTVTNDGLYQTDTKVYTVSQALYLLFLIFLYFSGIARKSRETIHIHLHFLIQRIIEDV